MKKYQAVICADGFTMSVQASQTAYCTPRSDSASEYTEVEIGYPSRPESLLMEWAESPDSPTDSVYAWVPVERVSLVLAKHGGIVEGEVPPGVANLRSCHES
jgi:hypothetical protein